MGSFDAKTTNLLFDILDRALHKGTNDEEVLVAIAAWRRISGGALIREVVPEFNDVPPSPPPPPPPPRPGGYKSGAGKEPPPNWACAFKRGDVVALHSGGPLMTVSFAGWSRYYGEPAYRCVWVTRSGSQKEDTYPESVLMRR